MEAAAMYDGGKIVTGLIVFVLIATFPLWYSPAAGESGERPQPEAPADKEHCVESKAYMLSSHMTLLNEWRDAYVREGKTRYTSVAFGDEYDASLTNTCLDCHSDREKFCDRCHEYADVDPYCWDCHMDSKGIEP
jgi:hypothetical protein